ncbi:MAG: hypothetical protein ABJG88_11715 [Litorimonas sp.]
MDLLLARKPDGSMEFIQPGQESRAAGATILSFCPAKDRDVSRGSGANRDKNEGLAGPSNPLPT